MRTMDSQMDHDFDDDMDRGMGRGSYRAMEADAPSKPETNDLTLGLTALLGIFFAVVLVCAVFFGFGYSTGRTLHGAKAVPVPTAAATPSNAPLNNSAGSEDATLAHSTPAPALVSTQPLAKPSAGAPSTASTDTLATGKDTFDEPTSFPPAVSGRRATTPAALRSIASSDDANARAANSSAPPAGAMMVQIAAVMHPADADMLARALRANGFSAVVRTEQKDKFLHVQVGPFATRDQAKAMRARLEADGYNAFLKP